METSSPRIICLQETNLDNDNIKELHLPPGWSAAFNQKLFNKMKGVGILIHNSLIPSRGCVEVIKDESTEERCLLICRVNKMIIISVYVHVNLPDPVAVYDDLNRTLSDLINERDEPMILCGDFNYGHHHHTLVENLRGLDFTPVYDKSGMPQPTHVAGNVLDGIFIREPIEAGALTIKIRPSDHHILETCVTLPPSDPLPTGFAWRKFDKLSDETMKELQDAIVQLAEQAAQEGDANVLQEGAISLLMQYIGMVKPKRPKPPKVWYTPQVRKLRRQCDICESNFQRTPTEESLTLLNDAIKAYETELKKQQRRAERQQASMVDEGKLSIWRVIPPKGGARFLARVIHNLGRQRDFLGALFDDDDPITLEMFDDDLDDGEEDTGPLFTEELIQQALTTTKDKTPAADDIRVRLFKRCGCPRLYKALAKLFSSLASANQPLPEWMRTGTGQVIFKKGDREDPANFRFIVMGSALAKIYEKSLEREGWRLIEEGSMSISDEQGGFRAKYGTEEQSFLLQCLRDGQRRRKRPLYAAFLDIKKAFDSVSHKKLLQVLKDKGAPDAYIRGLRAMLYNRKVSLFGEIIKMLKGTPQGCPNSPLLFILFVEPLIERLRAATGVQLTPEKFIQSLFFADDIVLTAESIEDLKLMLQICEEWAHEYGISFNASKSKLMQLAGPIPEERPEVHLDGKAMEWVTEFKYLGIYLYETQRKRVSFPRDTLWAKLLRYRHVLSPKSGLPLNQQRAVLESIVLSTALYPAALFDLEYSKIDTFMNKEMQLMTGISKKYSSTFLQCELGVLPAEYLAHIRSLNLLWRLENNVWYKDLLTDLSGPAPYKRLLGVATKYGVTVDDARSKSKASWSSLIKIKIKTKAANDLHAKAIERNLPPPEPQLKPRPYIKQGGAYARYGVVFRWHLLRQQHPQEWVAGPPPLPAEACTCCQSSHPPVVTYSGQSLLCRRLTHQGLRKFRTRVLCTMASEHDKKTYTTVDSAMVGHLKDLRWDHQTPETTRQVLQLIKRALSAASTASQKKKRTEVFMANQLSNQQLQEVRRKWREHRPAAPQLLVSYSNINITTADLIRLKDTEYLNDNIMDFYVELLKTRESETAASRPGYTRNHFFNTHFMTMLLNSKNPDLSMRGKYEYKQVRRWTIGRTQRVDLFACHQIFVPICINDVHWTLAVIDMEKKTIRYYDSLGDDGQTYLDALQTYVADEWRDKKSSTLPAWMNDWRLIRGSRATPQQDDHTNDCGVFVLCSADLLAQGLPLSFDQQDLIETRFRARIAYSILHKQLLP